MVTIPKVWGRLWGSHFQCQGAEFLLASTKRDPSPYDKGVLRRFWPGCLAGTILCRLLQAQGDLVGAWVATADGTWWAGEGSVGSSVPSGTLFGDLLALLKPYQQPKASRGSPQTAPALSREPPGWGGAGVWHPVRFKEV